MIRRIAFLAGSFVMAAWALAVSPPREWPEAVTPKAAGSDPEQEGAEMSREVTPPSSKHRRLWPIVYPRLLKPGATWSPLWVLPPLAPRSGK